MRIRVSAILLCAFLCLAPTASWADLAPYSQDFEGLVQADTDALANDGWSVFANVFAPDWSYLYGYCLFPAPNDGAAFCAIVSGQGGPQQGEQQLSVYSDYNNGDHGNGNFIEANVFQEQVIGAADVGITWHFEFDAKRGNIEGASTAVVFFKTLDPNAGFALTNFITVDMTNMPETWGSYLLSIFIDPSLEGQLLQFGFLSLATNFEGSGIFYDNIDFRGVLTLCHIPPGNPANAHTITVGLPAAQAHLNHGDTLGACENGFDPDIPATLGLDGPNPLELQQNYGLEFQPAQQPDRQVGGSERKRGARGRDE